MTLLYHIKQIGFTLPQVCTVIQNVDHRRQKYMVRALVTCVSLFLFSPHFYIFCYLLLNRGTTTWNIFVKCYFAKNEKKQNKENLLFSSHS